MTTSTLENVLTYCHIDPTGLDVRRLPIEIPDMGRQDLAKMFAALQFRTGAEIGVEQGVFAEVLCRKNPAVHLYAVDAWTAYRGYREHVSQDKLEEFYLGTMLRMAPYHCDVIRKFSVEASRDFKNGSLDFVYIDANHDFGHVVEDLVAWLPKVRSGGIIAGHDYCRRKNSRVYQCHVVEAILGYTGAYAIRPWFVVGAKQVSESETRDRPRSWFWVNE